MRWLMRWSAAEHRAMQKSARVFCVFLRDHGQLVLLRVRDYYATLRAARLVSGPRFCLTLA